MNSPKSSLLLWGGALVLSLGSLLAFTITIGHGRVTGPGVFLAAAVFAMGVASYFVFQAARVLVQTGADAEQRELQAAGGRRRKELEREYYTLKRAIKELELDYAMGKVSEQDYTEVRTRYRERAVRILRQLDQGESYRSQIDRDLQARREAKGLPKPATEAPPSQAAADTAPAVKPVRVTQSDQTPRTGENEKLPPPPESDKRVLPQGYEASIISEEPTKAAQSFADWAGLNSPSAPPDRVLPQGYEASIISEEPTKAVDQYIKQTQAQSGSRRDGLSFSDSATVMRAVANLTSHDGKNISTELTQQAAIPRIPSDPGVAAAVICPSCKANNDADAVFCKKCGTRLQAAAQ